MHITSQSALVTGGASGLGLATARRLAAAGARVVIADLPTSDGESRARDLGATFVPTDVTDAEQVAAAVATGNVNNDMRAVVHTAGRGGPVRFVDKDGTPGDAERFAAIVSTNLVGSYLVASHAAAAMSQNPDVDGERGVIVMTASIAAYEGQVGQAGYAASKSGVVGMTLVGARDMASRGVRLCTIAPGLMDTPMLAGLRDDVRQSLATSVPNPSRLGQPEEFAELAFHIVSNPYLNGETIRLDGALRMAPR
ncbi:SDR family oxidoreductase [Gordonia sp. KTR9]|uniref:SDR family oxidoreductase n=1 Tax=Gordonia sp. KTR9 TaxID=337191 RepID=UPI00031D63A4|nr:SDR family oxidoreductase [Gordonia sp. KTR9]